MSRIGKKPIPIPSGVTLKQEGRFLTVSGPHGEVTNLIPPLVKVTIEKDQVVVEKLPTKDKRAGAMWGLARTLIANMVSGVVEKFSKSLMIEGTGYRAQMKGSDLVLTLGYSHPVEYQVPQGITIKVPKPTEILVEGVDKQKVGQVAAEIRRFRKPEPYKGKGVRYAGEHIVRKVGKAGAK